MSNIAEGFERGSKAEFINFLYIAKGSCGEVRAQLQIAADQGYIFAAEYESASELSRGTSRMISNFIGDLQDTSYPGEKVSRPQRLMEDQAWARRKALHAVQMAKLRGTPQGDLLEEEMRHAEEERRRKRGAGR